MEEEDAWPQKIVDSGISASIDSALDLYREGDGPSSPEVLSVFHRQLEAIEGIRNGLLNVVPAMVPAAPLPPMLAAMKSVNTQISNWRANKNEAHIKSATPQIEAALVAFAQIPCAADSSAPQSEVQSLRRSVAQHIVQAEREVASLDEKLAESMSQIESHLAATSSKVSDTEASISRLKEDADSALDAARAQVGSQQQTFLEAQELRSSSFSDLLESSKELVGAKHEQLLHEVQESLEEAQSEAQSTLGKIEESQEKAQQILGIIGEQALVGTYSKLAKEEKDTANFLRWVAIGLTILTVALGVWMVVKSGSPGSDWDQFASRAVLTIPIGAAAAYAGRQSSEHRAAQRRSEDMALQLGSLGPFLSDLDKANRDKVLSQAATRLFGSKDDSPNINPEDSPATTDQLLPVLKALVEKM